MTRFGFDMRWLRFLLLLLVLPLAACALNGSAGTYQAETEAPYLLDTGDVVRVTVYGEADLSRSYRVDDSGAVALPLVGPVKVRGKSTQLAAAAIAAALAAGYLREPSVAVEIDTYRPFFIQGAVKNSGQYPYVYGMTLRAAISTAGGYDTGAQRGAATVYRRTGDEITKYVLQPDAIIQPGDTIVVGGGQL